MRISCRFEGECGFIFSYKLFSFKDGRKPLVSGSRYEGIKIYYSVVAVPSSIKKLGHLESGRQHTEAVEYFIAQLVI